MGVSPWSRVRLYCERMPSHRELVRFGAVVAARRSWLGLTRDQVHAAGGPADTTLARIENPTSTTAPPRARTLRRLDEGLRWSPGSAARTLAGGEPDPLDVESTEDSELSAAPNPLNFSKLEISVELVRGLLTTADAVYDVLTRRDLPEAWMPVAEKAADELASIIRKLSAAYATEVLERAGGPGRVLTPAVEMAYREHLSSSAQSADPEIAEEQLYRRWLAGKEQDLDEVTREAFVRRWQAKQRVLQARKS
ncbi:hypothetical protein SAMN04490239_0043 [Rhodococcus koreensis]|uniref:Helix-turn-helix domain-containing protein n=2 Tax=Rhodococcus koreensis TaxID=99653 RepID=A0A1H4I543_9NOCA|nr:hypothetical protein SAMN04490239_0043 [Rhodococcus koreensis]